MALRTLDLIELYTGDALSRPCHRLHLAAAIVARLEPKTADELADRVYPGQNGPADGLETLTVAYRQWKAQRVDAARRARVRARAGNDAQGTTLDAPPRNSR